MYNAVNLAVKDSGHKRFDPGFNVEILFESPEDPGLDRENIGEQFEHLLDVFMRLKESIVTEKKKNSDLQRELEKVKVILRETLFSHFNSFLERLRCDVQRKCCVA